MHVSTGAVCVIMITALCLRFKLRTSVRTSSTPSNKSSSVLNASHFQGARGHPFKKLIILPNDSSTRWNRLTGCRDRFMVCTSFLTWSALNSLHCIMKVGKSDSRCSMSWHSWDTRIPKSLKTALTSLVCLQMTQKGSTCWYIIKVSPDFLIRNETKSLWVWLFEPGRRHSGALLIG